MTVEVSAQQRIDPACPLRDAGGRLIGVGDRVRTVWGGNMGVVIGFRVITENGPMGVPTERPGQLGTYLCEPEQLEREEPTT